MDDLISRVSAKFQDCNWSVKPNAVIYEAIKEAIKSQLDRAPAVDAAPVRHGRWQGVSPMVDSMECSACRYCIPSEEFETPFCPWCGAKMDGDS